MKKKFISILISCLMVFSTGYSSGGEELISGSDKLSKTETAPAASLSEEEPADLLIDLARDAATSDPAQDNLPGEPARDAALSDPSPNNLPDEPARDTVLSEPAQEAALSEVLPEDLFSAPDDEAVLTDSPVEKHLPALPVSFCSMMERLTAQAQNPDMLSSVGASADNGTAFRNLAYYITTKGFYSSDYKQYHILYSDEEGIDWYIYYDPDNVRLEYYTSYTATDGTWVITEMILSCRFSVAIDVRINIYEDEEADYPDDTFVCTIKHPASYKGNETFTFYPEDSSITRNPDQTACNLILNLAFAGWNVLTYATGETLQSIGFSSFGGKASIAAPVITGFYNSVKGADIRWNKVPGATHYAVYRHRGAEGMRLVGYVDDENQTQFYDTDIKTNCWGRVYVYSVVAMQNNLSSAKSNEVTLQRLAPMRFTSYTSPAAGSAALGWTCTVSSNKAEGYEIQYAASKSDLSNRKGTFRTVRADGRNNLSKTITGLDKNTTWYFRIRAYVNYKHSVTGKQTKTWSQFSDVISFKPSGSAVKGTCRALLIGNADYNGYEENLDGPYNTTKAMNGILKNYGYSSVTVKKDLKASQITSQIRSTFAKATKNDVSLFFFDGHGDTYTGALEGVDGNVVTLANLANILKEVPGKVIIILENCGSGGGVYKVGNSAEGSGPDRNSSTETGSDGSGSDRTSLDRNFASFDPELFNRQVIAAFAAADPGLETETGAAFITDGSELPQVGWGELRNSKFLVLTATTLNEESWEYADGGSDIWGGALTRAIAEATGCTFPAGSYKGSIPADSDKNKKLTLKELYGYVRPRVSQMVKQLNSVQHVSCYPENSSGVMFVKS